MSPQESEAKCLDCGLDYADFPMDVVLPRSQWLEIHPDDGGLLCASCIVKRCAKIPRAIVVHAIVEIAPPAPQNCENCDNLRRFDLTKEYFNCPTLNIRVHGTQVGEFGCSLWQQKIQEG